MEKYLVIIQKAGNNYGAYSPDVLGCISTGKTIEETLQNMRDALIFHLEGMMDDNEPLPLSKGLAYYLQQPAPIANENDLITYVHLQIPQLV